METKELKEKGMRDEKVTEHKHLCVNIRGMINQFRRKSMTGLIVDNGRELSDEEVRNNQRRI